MNIEYTHNKIWLVREDGWRYPLDGIVSLDIEYRDGWFYTRPSSGTYATAILHDLSDKTLASLRVLRDELPEHITLRVESRDD